MIYVEDFVVYFMKECIILLVGNDFVFVVIRYVLNVWSVLKVFFWFFVILFGIVFGKIVVYGLFFSKYNIFLYYVLVFFLKMMIIYFLLFIFISFLMKFNKIFDILNYICDWKKKVRNFSSFYFKLDNFNFLIYI